MATWAKEELPRENGELVQMQVPEIVSASRSTDIPAFYADWFFHRLKVGYSAWTNPFNGVKGYVSYKNTRFIVFWSKNPRPLLNHLGYLKERGIGCYIQYTLNDYEDECLEKGVPPIQERIDTFKRLVDKLGVGSVIWRFDPLMLTDTIDIDALLEKIEIIGKKTINLSFFCRFSCCIQFLHPNSQSMAETIWILVPSTSMYLEGENNPIPIKCTFLGIIFR